MIRHRSFPTAFAFLPSSEYVFEQTKESRELTTRIVAEACLANGMHVLALNCGILCFEFAGTALGQFEKAEFQGQGEVPDEVISNNEAMLDLQSKRHQMAMFATACIYGRHAFLTHSGLRGPRYPGLDDLYGGAREGDTWLMSVPDVERLKPHLREREAALAKRSNAFSIPAAHFHEGMALADRLLAADAVAEAADFVALIVMYYQAAILHARQHAGASIALSAVILEVAIAELFFTFGLVDGTSPQAHAKTAHSCGQLSRNAFRDLGFGGMLKHLCEGKLVSRYLADRIESVRKARNDLMHRGRDLRAGKSGEGLTAVRDVLRLCTGEEFELAAAFSYRT